MRSSRVTLEQLLRFVLCGALIGVTLSTAAPSRVGAQPATSFDGALGPVSLEATSTTVASDGAMEFDVTVDLANDVGYLEIRAQLLHPTGRLIYQRTFVENEVPRGVARATFERGLDDLSLRPGLYPINIRVRVDDGGEARERVLEDRLLIYDPESEPMSMTIVARIAGAPNTDAAGRFLADSGRPAPPRDATAEIARFVVGEPRARLSIAIPPMLLQEWVSASDGYESAGPEGVITVPADDPAAVAYAETMDSLRQALDTGRLTLVDVPFADPSPAALMDAGRAEDILDHLSRGSSTYLATLGRAPDPIMAPPGPCLPQDMPSLISAHGIETVIVSADCVVSGETTPSTGVYSLGPSNTMSALVSDSEAETHLAAGDARELTDRLFTIAISSESTPAAAAVVELGPGRRTTPAEFVAAVASLVDEPWLTTVAAPATRPGETTPVVELRASDDMQVAAAPRGYWHEVDEARRFSEAFLAATGPNDADADVAVINSLLAQSRAWAGADGSWSLAERGRSFASASLRESLSRLEAVTLSARTMTLSSSSGMVPISIVNGSDKSLNVVIKVEPQGLSLTDWRSKQVLLQPSENFFTIPVNLESSISGKVNVRVLAGDEILTEETIAVQASYLDRLAAIAGVSLALLGILWFIRKRVRAAEAGAVPQDEEG